VGPLAGALVGDELGRVRRGVRRRLPALRHTPPRPACSTHTTSSAASKTRRGEQERTSEPGSRRALARTSVTTRRASWITSVDRDETRLPPRVACSAVPGEADSGRRPLSVRSCRAEPSHHYYRWTDGDGLGPAVRGDGPMNEPVPGATPPAGFRPRRLGWCPERGHLRVWERSWRDCETDDALLAELRLAQHAFSCRTRSTSTPWRMLRRMRVTGSVL